MTAFDTTAIQATNLRNLLNTGAFQFVDERTPWFPYTSGQVGPYYVQSTTVEKDGAAYATAIRSLSKGRAAYSMEPFSFEPVPASIVSSILDSTKPKPSRA